MPKTEERKDGEAHPLGQNDVQKLTKRIHIRGHCTTIGGRQRTITKVERVLVIFGDSTLSCLSLSFWRKGRENHKKTRTFYPYRTPKIPGKEAKNAQKEQGNPRNEKKTRNKKKRGRTGYMLSRVTSGNWVRLKTKVLTVRAPNVGAREFHQKSNEIVLKRGFQPMWSPKPTHFHKASPLSLLFFISTLFLQNWGFYEFTFARRTVFL